MRRRTTRFDKRGIAKNAREEKIRAREAKLKQDAENARMAKLYREQILGEKPVEGLVSIDSIAPAKPVVAKRSQPVMGDCRPGGRGLRRRGKARKRQYTPICLDRNEGHLETGGLCVCGMAVQGPGFGPSETVAPRWVYKRTIVTSATVPMSRIPRFGTNALRFLTFFRLLLPQVVRAAGCVRREPPVFQSGIGRRRWCTMRRRLGHRWGRGWRWWSSRTWSVRTARGRIRC